MIFASVGSTLPFDRFVRAVDEWAGANPATSTLIQIGRGEYLPRHAEWTRMMPMEEYRRHIRESRLFVAHVGMGSILQGLEERRQMLLMPRLQRLGEHTTDHQLDTAARFRDRAGIRIVDDADALKAAISELVEQPMRTDAAISSTATPEMLEAVAAFLRPFRMEAAADGP